MPGFYQLSLADRRRRLGMGEPERLSDPVADQMIENAIGVMGLPLGVALNFVVDGAPVIVPMATEEPSIIAAASYVAKLVATSGGFSTQVDEPVMIGQVQLTDLPDIDRARAEIQSHEIQLIALANQYCEAMKARGGGCVGLQTRVLPQNCHASEGWHPVDGMDPSSDSWGDKWERWGDNRPMLIVDLLVNCCDAMGANIVNTVVEGVGPELARISGGTLGFQILSNLSDRRMARAWCEVPFRALATDVSKDNGRDIALRMVSGYQFACLDIYRASTHNKGIMNGIDAVAIATGNDWRAIEAGAHAYAARTGHYTSLSHYELDDERSVLKCRLELPMAVGVVGGSTRNHPTVVSSLNLMGDHGRSAKKLAGVMAAVGLAQNMGALKALASEGIQRGHMALHHRKANIS